MNPGNFSETTEFFLLGLSEDPDLQPVLFALFLSMYLVTVLGNLVITMVIISDSHLHTPMYFFLSSLSFVDICFTTTTIPKMLVNIQVHSKSISYTGCLTQICFALVFLGLENGILVTMAYDRFVAICHPLRYNVIMKPKLCRLLVLLSFLISVLDALLHTSMALRLSFCTNLEIPHFFCELAHLLKLACSDILINNILVYLVTGLLGAVPLSGIIFSYTQIVSSVLKIPSAGRKYKVFSICGSHLIVVSLFYGTGFGVYLSSTAKEVKKAPVILEKLHNRDIPEGHPVRLECPVIGMPPPMFYWKKDNETIPFTRERVSMHQDTTGYVCLLIQPAKKSDTGWYTLSAKNEAGIVSCTGRLDIYAQWHQQIPPPMPIWPSHSHYGSLTSKGLDIFSAFSSTESTMVYSCSSSIVESDEL
ncbi:Olfactory receptor 7G3 [Heterocephalus glaber]|uniref:Olfactory receptor 7G3 n=1 Tax=Heterocephalus glaber TaxID=10181 RepID=G5ANG8_HETGA|nr:Olfactory receptor 7G3 [Heterocephalus glaber]